MTKPPRAKASATQLQGESGAREKGHPTPAAAPSEGGEIGGVLACKRLHVGRGLMIDPSWRPAASARATARFVPRAYFVSPSCQSAGSKRSAWMAGCSSTPSGCAEGSPMSWLRLCSSTRCSGRGMASFPCCNVRRAVLRGFGEGAPLSAARQIGAEPRRRAAQEAIITLERQHGQAFALFHRQKADTAWPDRELAGDKLMFAAPRLGTVMARRSEAPSSTKFNR